MAHTTKLPFYLLVLLLLAACCLAGAKEKGKEAVKELGSHALREGTRKVWEYFESGEFLDDLQDFGDQAADFAVGVAQVVVENL